MTKDFSLGPTFEGFFSTIGLISCGFGVFYFFVFHLYLFGSSLFLVGLPVFFSIKGTVLDFSKRRFKPYFHCFIFKLGFWESIDTIESLELDIYNQSQNLNLKGALVSTYTVRTFDLVLQLKNKEKIILAELKDPSEGRRIMEELSKEIQIPFSDKYEILRESIEERKEYTR
ncbi:MAG: hypothetical protein K9I36_06995 [Bacteroidia bacterium]|nr:hypothetical protein [Bacteroidia bacterium]MCF8426460.1 hypothetical protein [Bacteroidia bacterium]